MVDELAEIGESGRDLGVVARRIAGSGSFIASASSCKRPVIDRERLERRKHPAEHAGIVVAG